MRTPRQAPTSERRKEWAVVTGASDGIGRAFADRLAARGFNLVLIARREALLSQIATTLRAEHSIETRVLALDLTNAQSNESIAETTRELDVSTLIAAAGFGTTGAFHQLPVATELEMISVNCVAPTALVHHFAPRLIARGGGRIVLMSSIVGFAGVAGTSTYAATKAYIQALAEGLHRELAPHGIHVLASAPGPTHSGFAARAGMRMSSATDPTIVAEETLRASASTITVRPGLLTKVLDSSLRTVPRYFRSSILSRVIGGMISR